MLTESADRVALIEPRGRPDETDPDEGEQGGKDETQHVGVQRKGEQDARDRTDRADGAHGERCGQVADVPASERHDGSEGGGEDHEQRGRFGFVLRHPHDENEERHEQDAAADPEQPGEHAGARSESDEQHEEPERAQRPTTMRRGNEEHEHAEGELELPLLRAREQAGAGLGSDDRPRRERERLRQTNLAGRAERDHAGGADRDDRAK